MAPAKAREAAEIAIGGDPLAAGLDRQRREIGIRHQVALGAGAQTEALEDLPVTRAGRDDHGGRLGTERGGELEGTFDGRRRREDARVRRHPDEPAQDELREPDRLV